MEGGITSGMIQHCLRALRILNLTGVILRHILPVRHKSGTKNILFSKTVHFLQVQVQVLYCFTAVILNRYIFCSRLMPYWQYMPEYNSSQIQYSKSSQAVQCPAKVCHTVALSPPKRQSKLRVCNYNYTEH